MHSRKKGGAGAVIVLEQARRKSPVIENPDSTEDAGSSKKAETVSVATLSGQGHSKKHKAKSRTLQDDRQKSNAPAKTETKAPSASLVKAAEVKMDLVLSDDQRQDKVRAMAEAWGLGHGDDVSDDDNGESDFDHSALSRGVGLGLQKVRDCLPQNTLEGRLERGKLRKKNQPVSIELTEWDDAEGADDTGERRKVNTGKASSDREHRHGRRVRKTIDQLSGKSDAVHPLARTAELDKKM